MKKLLFLLIGLTLFSIYGCRHKIDEGYVVGKEYEPYRAWVFFMPMRFGKTTTLIPMIMHDNEDFIITVRGDYEGEPKVEHFYIDKEQYYSLKINDFICVSDMCNKDKNNEKERK